MDQPDNDSRQAIDLDPAELIATDDRGIYTAITHPTLGVRKLVPLLAKQGISMSFRTVSNILNKHKTGSRFRLFAFLNLSSKTLSSVDPQQIRAIERLVPSFKDRGTPSSKPSAVLCQCILHTFTSRSGDFHVSTYLHAIIEAHSGTAFVYPRRDKTPDTARKFLFETMRIIQGLLFVNVSSVRTPRSRTFTGRKDHVYSSNLWNMGIKHVLYPGLLWKRVGIVESYRRYILDRINKEFHIGTGKGTPIAIEVLDKFCQNHTDRYNHGNKTGYPWFGLTPVILLHQLDNSQNTRTKEGRKASSNKDPKEMKRRKRYGRRHECFVAREITKRGIRAVPVKDSGKNIIPSYDVEIPDLNLAVQVKKRSGDRMVIKQEWLDLVNDRFIIMFSARCRRGVPLVIYVVTRYKGFYLVNKRDKFAYSGTKRIRIGMANLKEGEPPIPFFKGAGKTVSIKAGILFQSGKAAVYCGGRTYLVQQLDEFLAPFLTKAVHNENNASKDIRSAI
jgi:hypothetical protein